MGQGVGWGQSRQAWEDMQLEAIISTGEKVVEQLEKLRGGVLKKAPQEYGDRRARSVWSWPERDKLFPCLPRWCDILCFREKEVLCCNRTFCF